MKNDVGNYSKSVYALFFAILLCLGIFSPTVSIVVAADELTVPEASSTEVVKNAKWVALGCIRTRNGYTTISSSFKS